MAKDRSGPELDRELTDLPPELCWREWLRRVEAVLFASAFPVPGESKRDIKQPKFHFVDTGLASALRRLNDRPFDVGNRPEALGGLLEMGWFPPSPDGIAMCQSRAVESDKTERMVNERYNDRSGSGKERFPTPRGFDDWSGQVPQEADTAAISSIHGRSRASNCSHGSVGKLPSSRCGGAFACTTPVRPLGQAYFGRTVTIT